MMPWCAAGSMPSCYKRNWVYTQLSCMDVCILRSHFHHEMLENETMGV